jgi:dienelactone hydrolase
LVDQTLGHYEIVELLGAGGMGEVYRAHDRRLHRDVALKVLPPGLAPSPELLERFEREARAVAALSHPNIVTIFSVEDDDGVRFLTMELIAGKSLARVIPAGGLPLDRFIDLALQLSRGVAAAHQQGIIHRDLKPDNVMVTDDGQTKILDFGLAKLHGAMTESAFDSKAGTALMTQQGCVLGTPAYMAPEQAEGRAVDARADVFALGAVFYQMLTGSRPFSGESRASLQAAILASNPRPPRELRGEIPKPLDEFVLRCLAKDPQQRYDSGADLEENLRSFADAGRPTEGRARSPVMVVLVILLAVAAAGTGWLWMRSSSLEEARQEALPKIEALLDSGETVRGYLLARETATILPDDPELRDLLQRASTPPGTITTEPAGATVFYRDFRDDEIPWQHLGSSPLEKVQLPVASFLRWRIEKEGYDRLEVSASPLPYARLDFVLTPHYPAPPGMLHVPPGSHQFRNTTRVEVPGFWLDRHEVTNGEFKQFVDAGGYDTPDYWRHSFDHNGRELTFEEAMALFVDSTGRPGPATWALGDFDEGAQDLPVGGVSWYEAAAYAEFAGKSLPTVYHWRRAAPPTPFGDILLRSNFSSEGSVAVDSLGSLGRYGHVDMRGNVSEWCLNEAEDGRYLLGGSWQDPPYIFSHNSARDPMERERYMGFRCAVYPEPPGELLIARLGAGRYDFSGIETANDEVFAFYRSLYEYEPGELEPVVELVDSSARHWTRETVSFNAAYGKERVKAHLFLPKDIDPPYKTVVYVPGSTAGMVSSIEDMLSRPVFFIPRSGRALVWPVYQGTLERIEGRPATRSDRAVKDLMVQKVNDLQRAIDYLETREDVDAGNLVYFGLSAGAEYGPLYTAVETRFKALAYLAGGYDDTHMLEEPPEVNPWHYTPRVTIPTLMVNGESDHGLPVETAQKPMFEQLGVPVEHKRHVLLEGGHWPNDNRAVMREILDWYDRYQGPVR